ncbi:MAG: AAA family ATPase [bacterium]|nr:AAA family ATPase [bacterium]
MKKIIGLTGEPRAGKSSFIKILTEIVKPLTIERISSGEILTAIADAVGLQKSRSNLQNLAIAIYDNLGKDVISYAVLAKMAKNYSDIIIFDGVRWESDVDMLRRFENSMIVYITADVRIRWQRARKAAEKADEAVVSLDQFEKEEQARTELLIRKIGERADFRITNNGTENDLRKQVLDFYKQKLKGH